MHFYVKDEVLIKRLSLEREISETYYYFIIMKRMSEKKYVSSVISCSLKCVFKIVLKLCLKFVSTWNYLEIFYLECSMHLELFIRHNSSVNY